MSTVAELKKRFEQSKGGALTPEQHAAALRQKERDLQEATRIAKARAARYNMTLRSLELANAAKNTEQQTLDRKKRESAFKGFAQPGRRVSNMKQSAQAKVEISQQILGSALSHTAGPETAVEVVKAVAQHVEETLQPENLAVDADSQAQAKQEAEERALEEARREEEQRLAEEAAEKEKQERQAAAAKAAEEEARAKAAAEEAANAAAAAAAAEAEAARKAEEEAAAAKAAEEEEKPVDDGARFEMTSLSKALDQGNEEAINKAVVTDFLAEHDPAKLPEVDKLLEENKGKEDELMRNLAEKYSDPEATEIKVTAEVIVQIETEGKVEPPPPAAEESEDVDFVEQQRREAERIKLEEEAKISAMDDNEKKAYMEKLAAQAKHQEEKDKMLKSQLNVYGNGASALLGGRGRGRGKARPKSGHSEYIVSAVNQGGSWEVNAE